MMKIQKITRAQTRREITTITHSHCCRQGQYNLLHAEPTTPGAGATSSKTEGASRRWWMHITGGVWAESRTGQAKRVGRAGRVMTDDMAGPPLCDEG